MKLAVRSLIPLCSILIASLLVSACIRLALMQAS